MNNNEFENKESTYEICDECGEVLPDPVVESREGNCSEFVTYCKCGAVYTN